uniref:Calsyntenin-1 n=1 Tax=Hirondellea gigas TaxID=1518452 RepID=A0A6A7FN01_9CRUS
MWITVVLSATLLLLLPLATSGNSAGQLPDAPRFELLHPSSGYHGLVSEDNLVVDVLPQISAQPDVCAFNIVAHHTRSEIPFMIRVKDAMAGTAELVATRELNCEQRKNYHFDIAARSCSGLLSNNVTVHVKVGDVNEFAPVFSEPSYVVSVDEGRLYQELVALQAHDNDCSPKYGDICRYELLTQDQPFSIDSEGVVSNTEPLDFERSHNHILSVVAYDCGMKRSQPVMLTVKVNRVCHLGWKGIPSQVEYWPGSGRQELFPQATLELCSVPCEVQEVHARVTLSTQHIGRGCDRDTYSVAQQRKICGANTDSVDLLPAPGPEHSWTAGLHSDDGAVPAGVGINGGGSAGEGTGEGTGEGSNGDVIYEFDGDGVVVPQSVLTHNLTNTFTVSTWMKHGHAKQDDKHTKEHLLCLADDHQMNRHHVAVFVRNCRLILLVRHESTDGGLNTFQPAEWRWKLPQVCDDEWHHYSVQANLPEVTLFVDGHTFHPETGDSPEVLDDWPLHPTKGINTTLAVGGCWQGSEGRMQHGFTGSLAGLNVLVGSLEPVRVLSCLTRCQEALDTPAMELLQPSMELLTNNEMTQISIEGDNITNLETLLRRVAYINSRDLPTPGRRPLDIHTNILCGSGNGLRIASVSSQIVVMPPHQPAIIINGTANFAQEYQSFRAGLRIFPDVTVTLAQQMLEEGSGGLPPLSSDFPNRSSEVSECAVSVYPPLNPDHETLSLPDSLIRDLGLTSTVSRQGTTIAGPHTAARYTAILRQLHYANRKPAYYLNRAFKLTCSQLGGRFTSNEYQQTVTVIHPQLSMDRSSGGGGSSSADDSEQTLLEEEDEGDTMGHQATLDDLADAGDAAEDNTVLETMHSNMAAVAATRGRQAAARAAHARVSGHHVDMRADGYYTATDVEGVHAAGAGHAVTVIVVVCVGFLLCLVVLGVIRLRAAHSRHAGAAPAPSDHTADAEMAWDDSPLNITLNPMEQMEITKSTAGHKTRSSSVGTRNVGGAVPRRDEDEENSDEESSSDDEASSNFADDMDDSTDEEQDEVEVDDSAAKRKELEWDDSTLKM